MRRTRRLIDMPADGADPLPPISVVVPALNEESTIGAAMRTLLAMDYPGLEIIAVEGQGPAKLGLHGHRCVQSGACREVPRHRRSCLHADGGHGRYEAGQADEGIGRAAGLPARR